MEKGGALPSKCLVLWGAIVVIGTRYESITIEFGSSRFYFILCLTKFEKEKYAISLQSFMLWSLVLELGLVNTNCDQLGLRSVF